MRVFLKRIKVLRLPAFVIFVTGELHNRTSNVQEVNAQLEELQSELERRAEEEDPRKVSLNC